MASGNFNGLVGQRIREIRDMTPAELAFEGWEPTRRHGTPKVIVLDNNALIYPARDYEGNGPGVFFGSERNGERFAL